MTSSKRLALTVTLALAASTALATLAEAQNRRGPLKVTVQKRSYLNPGNMVLVGSLNRYATQASYASPVYSGMGDSFGEGALPGRIGAGANPFANTFATPRY